MREIKRLLWIEAISYLAFGFYLFFKPDLALRTIIVVYAISTLVYGIVGLIMSIRNSLFADRTLLGGVSVLFIILGLLLLCFPAIGETVIKIFVVLIGILIIFKGIFLLSDSISIKKLGVNNWYWMLFLGCLLMLVGLFFTINSFATILLFNMIIGICLLSEGVAILVRLFKAKEISK